LIKNEFYQQVQQLEDRGATSEEIRELLGRGRSKRGIFEGDLSEGELEIGQIASHIREIIPAGQVIEEMIGQYNQAIHRLSQSIIDY
jgi:enoyl-[acyl-carrier protein] reductase II